MSSLTSRSLGPTHELGTLVINDDGYWLDLFITDLFEYGTGVECSFSGIDHGGKFGFSTTQCNGNVKTRLIVDGLASMKATPQFVFCCVNCGQR